MPGGSAIALPGLCPGELTTDNSGNLHLIRAKTTEI